MRKLSLIAGIVMLTAVCVNAAPKLITIENVMTGVTTLTNTSEKVVGYIEEIQVAVSDGVSTGTVAVTVQPADSTVAAYSIATNSVVDESRWRPRVDGTDDAGTALTSDPPGRYFLIGDTVGFEVSGSPSNVTWKCRIKVSTDR
jgi:hypothetical protein